jgi:hypothetical protein
VEIIFRHRCSFYYWHALATLSVGVIQTKAGQELPKGIKCFGPDCFDGGMDR